MVDSHLTVTIVLACYSGALFFLFRHDCSPWLWPSGGLPFFLDTVAADPFGKAAHGHRLVFDLSAFGAADQLDPGGETQVLFDAFDTEFHGLEFLFGH